jgi:hypothetical protein
MLRRSAPSFEFHFIRVATEAQGKPAATLTCLLNVSSALISVVMRSLATCLCVPTLERSKGRTQNNDRDESEEGTDDSDHFDIKNNSRDALIYKR